MKKSAFIAKIQSRWSLGWHMAGLLTATGALCYVISLMLRLCGLTDMAVRFPLTALLGYGAFLVLVQAWVGLWDSSYRTTSPSSSLIENGDVVVDLVDAVGNHARSAEPVLRTAGEQALRGLEVPAEAMPQVADALEVVAETAEASEGVADVAVGAASLFDEGAVVLVVLAVIAGAMCGVWIYLICQGPSILAEVLFCCYLAKPRIARKYPSLADNHPPFPTLIERTWASAALIVVFAFLMGTVATSAYPEAVTLGQAIALSRGQKSSPKTVSRTHQLKHGAGQGLVDKGRTPTQENP
jgi:hypothetical protein